MPPELELATKCYESYRIESSWQMRTVYITGGVWYITTTILLLRAVRDRKNRYVPAHANFKIIVTNATVAIFCQTVPPSFSVWVAVYKSFTETPDNCKTLIGGLECVALRGASLITVPLLTLLHMVTLVERLCAYFHSERYEKRSKWYGIASVPLAWMLAALTMYYVVKLESREVLMTHCTLTTNTNATRILRFYQVVMVADVIIAVCDGCLACVTSRKKSRIVTLIHSKRFSRDYDNYTLSRAYQENENGRILSMVFPVTTAFAFGHIVYAGLATVFRVFLVNPDDYRDFETYIDKKIILLSITEGIHMIFTTTLMVVIQMYCRMGERLMNEKMAKVHKPDTDITFKLFNQQINYIKGSK
ncbi:unnamed protein product [Bursaphelenchus okinawaensis]|uniref:G_PROTEIN_RECEP_F1_2 domain-containing protein n=1 Tax=Bursaphelenchus okinawaensis TaxID=465554 RepID=A0A811LV67_9BILA|nr:unnamed protein product [Bursaphelenchus okinawaensis]CAG9128169.1 unnamed protein product [Bursaphelenchus okinawaensis]